MKYVRKHIRFDMIEVSITEEGDGELKHCNNISLFLNAIRQNDERI